MQSSRHQTTEWLKPSQIVYSQKLGVGLVKAIIGNKLYLEVGTTVEEINNWLLEVENLTLLPIEKAPQTKNVKYGKFSAFLQKNQLLVHTSVLSAKDAIYTQFPNNISSIIKQALTKTGINQLYSHQLKAWNAYTRACDIALLTETSSGKSLAFLIPALHECLQNNSVLIFFNLKGLALDQSQKIQEILKHIPAQIRPRVLNINGDTPRNERLQKYTNTPTIICATPDAFSHDLAACKGNNWQLIETLLKIKLIIIDEMHLYNGTFGANFALLNKRMQLKIEMLGGKPDDIKYIFASATIGNPVAIASMISNRCQDNLVIINSSGAKSFEKKFDCLRSSKMSTQHAAMCLVKLVELGITTICFTTSRAQSKAIALKASNMLSTIGRNDLARAISAFYGAMKPAQRTKIIDGLRTGAIKGIVSTSALEAGIDIASIDATIVCKYPGSILSARQQMGRAGRHDDGLIVFIPSDYSVIDGYYARSPEKLFSDDAEIISFNQNYESILSKHIIACCSESKPTGDKIEKYFGSIGLDIMQKLLNDETLIPSFNKRVDANPKLGYYHMNINMRGSDGNIEYINKDTGEEFETSSASIAIQEVYPGAIYPAQNIDGKAVKYRVSSLDLESGKSILTLIDAKSTLYTICQDNFKISKLKPNGEEKIIKFGDNNSQIQLIPIWGLIEQSVNGYELHNKESRWTCNNKKCYNYHQKIHINHKICPDCLKKLREMEVDEIIETTTYPQPIAVKYETAAIEVVVNDSAIIYFQANISEAKELIQANIKYGIDAMTREVSEVFTSEPTQLAIHTIAHQLILALPLVKHESNTKDIEFVLSDNPNPIIGHFFDTTPNGTGGCDTLVEYWSNLLGKAILLVDNCDCKHGCHKCTTIHRCPDENETIFKHLGVKILK